MLQSTNNQLRRVSYYDGFRRATQKALKKFQGFFLNLNVAKVLSDYNYSTCNLLVSSITRFTVNNLLRRGSGVRITSGSPLQNSMFPSNFNSYWDLFFSFFSFHIFYNLHK